MIFGLRVRLKERCKVGKIYRNGKTITPTRSVKDKTLANDLNAVMTGNFYDILTDSFIDQIMTGHYIKKGE